MCSNLILVDLSPHIKIHPFYIQTLYLQSDFGLRLKIVPRQMDVFGLFLDLTRIQMSIEDLFVTQMGQVRSLQVNKN